MKKRKEETNSILKVMHETILYFEKIHVGCCTDHDIV